MDLPNFVEEPDPATTAVAVAVPEQAREFLCVWRGGGQKT